MWRSLARDFWRLAVDSANDALAGERDTLADRAEADQQIALAREETLAALALVNAVTARLDIASETIAGRDEAIRRLEDSLAEARATRRAKDERIAGLTDELARTAQQQAASLVELDGLRKHSLLQIDQARGEVRHCKAEFERGDHENRTTHETYRQKASSLATDLAGARGRLSAIEEALTSARLPNADLEHRMSPMQAERPPVQPQPRPAVSAAKRLPAAGKGMASALRRRTLGS